MENKEQRLPYKLISYVSVKRNNWIIKVSVNKISRNVLVIANHVLDKDVCVLKFLSDENKAADFIEFLITQE